MNKKNIMFLGTASSVGKSTLAAALCRYLVNDGFNVSPFKALNISLNSFVTKENLEMGRAQVVQAEACKIEPKAIMNPVLLKPGGNVTQVIVEGKVYKNIEPYKYKELNEELKVKVKQAYDKLKRKHDIIVLEGSGSCAEINLRDSDIANMYMAKRVNAPVILVADIDRGGVFASIVGTLQLLKPDEKKLVKGVIINKFRGNKEFFKDGIKELESIINIPVIGVMPYEMFNIEDEDSVTEKIKNEKKEGTIDKPLGRHKKERIKMAIVEDGKRAVTHYEVLEEYNKGVTLIKCTLETGRTHQIRVHMASIGHPLVGDLVYGHNKQKIKIEGQALHAKTLGFIHPSTREYMEFNSELPDYFNDILTELRK